MSLIAGSYERFIWGFKLKPTNQPPDQTLTLTQLFSYPSHLGPITAASASGPVAASGSSDDTIHLYDLGAASSLGPLPHHHTSSITSLSFFTPASLSFPRNLVSADSSGSVCIFDADPFVHLKTIKAHKKAVNDLSLHPSGRLALTVGRDECLGMLNLVRGRRSFCCRLGKEASLVRFGLDGERFYLVTDNVVGVHEAEDARLVHELACPKRVLTAVAGESGLLFTGGEDRGITAWDTNSRKAAYSIENAHSSRVKGIVVLTRNDDGAADDPYLLASAASDGVIRVWDVRMAMKEKANPLAEANTKSRLTCLAGSSLKSLRRPQMGSNVSKENPGAAMEEL